MPTPPSSPYAGICIECGANRDALLDDECVCGGTVTPEDDWVGIRSVPTFKEAYGPIEERQEIHTLEGDVIAEPGDYIVRESDGAVYPIAPEKLEEYYEVQE